MPSGSEFVDRVVDLAWGSGKAHWSLDWSKIETSLGYSLPSDYKRLCDELPPGSFNDFLFLLHPIGCVGASLLGRAARLIEIVEMLMEDEEECPGEPGRIFPCLVTDNGDVGYWIADSDDPDGWTIAINKNRSPVWESTGLPLSVFLYQFIIGESDVFPESFQEGRPAFASDLDY